MLFGEREFNIFAWENGTNFDASTQGADVVAQWSEFDFGTLSETGNYALLDWRGFCLP